MASENTLSVVASCALSLLLGGVLGAAEVTPGDTKAAEESISQQVAAAKAAIDDLEVKRAEAAKKQRFQELKRLNIELKAANQQLQAKNLLSAEALAQVIANEREAADKARANAELVAQRQREMAAAEERDEQERLRLTGGCPLEIISGNFFHSDGGFSRALGRPGPSTVAQCTTSNRSSGPVQAYELIIQFYDGFGKLIDEHTVQAALIKPHESQASTVALREAETAVEMRIYVNRAKLADGTVWERKPEHRRTVVSFRKPEGAARVD